MIRLRDKETGELLGDISEAELKFLVEEFEEESPGDQDYYLDQPTLDMLRADNAPPGLVELLQRALGSREGMEIRWSRG